jgi:TPR repeat protein
MLWIKQCKITIQSRWILVFWKYVQQNFSKAFDFDYDSDNYYSKSWRLDFSKSSYKLGLRYSHRFDISQNIPKSIESFEKSISKNDGDCILILDQLYFDGVSVD